VKKNEAIIIEKAVAILSREGMESYYDGNEAALFFEAVKWIEKAMNRTPQKWISKE
jgi:hypothetical protein